MLKHQRKARILLMPTLSTRNIDRDKEQIDCLAMIFGLLAPRVPATHAGVALSGTGPGLRSPQPVVSSARPGAALLIDSTGAGLAWANGNRWTLNRTFSPGWKFQYP